MGEYFCSVGEPHNMYKNKIKTVVSCLVLRDRPEKDWGYPVGSTVFFLDTECTIVGKREEEDDWVYTLRAPGAGFRIITTSEYFEVRT